jgi:hypothetical protein
MLFCTAFSLSGLRPMEIMLDLTAEYSSTAILINDSSKMSVAMITRTGETSLPPTLFAKLCKNGGKNELFVDGDT